MRGLGAYSPHQTGSFLPTDFFEEPKFGNGETAEIGYTNRPVIEVIAGQPVVGQQVKSLGSVARENGETRAWEYAVDEKLNPTMNIDNRLIVWNPAKRYAISDGDWSYDIKPAENPRHNAAIGRTNGSRQKEFWHYNQAKGEEIVQGIDGVRKVTTWFTRGKLAGSVRTRRISSNSEAIEKFYSYAEDGDITRELIRINGSDRSTREWLPDGTSIETPSEPSAGPLLYYDEEGVVRGIFFSSSETTSNNQY